MASEAVPTVSVILPVYNAERYLRSAVESVLEQTFTDFELVALNDGSTDSSLAILREFEKKDRRVRVVSRENRGLVSTLNELIELSQGSYLARMDSDDICLPNRLAVQVQYLDDNPDCVAVGSRILFIDPDGMPIYEFGSTFNHEEIDSAHLSGLSGSRICHPSVIMRRKAVLQVGSYLAEFRYAQDLELFLRLAEVGRLANVRDVLLQYRYNLKSISFVHGDEQSNYALAAVRSARKRRGMSDLVGVQPLKTQPISGDELHRNWAWWAMAAGNIRTARKHAIKALIKKPFSIDNLRVAACTIRGY